MFGKIENGRLVIAGKRIENGKGGEITNPTNEQLIELGYKEIEYTEKPTFDKEEEKLIETYTEEEVRIVISYEKVALAKDEKIEIIKQEIIDEEDKITKRNILDFAVDKDNEALNRIQQHRNVIIELRAKLREIEGE